jgi:hypothetical protein
MNENTEKKGPGRPKYQPKFPRKLEWTFQDFMETNSVEINPDSARYGKSTLPKGEKNRCTKLTLIKYLDADLFIREEAKKGKRGEIVKANSKSLVVRLTDIFAGNELGRKGFMYCLRDRLNERKPVTPPAEAQKAIKRAKANRKPRAKSTQTDLSPATKQYEEIKTILSTPTPAPEVAPTVTPVSVPVATAPAPESVVVPTPTPAPVAETPTPTVEPVTPTPTA